MINKFKIQSSKFKIIVAITLLTFNFTLYTATAIAADSTPSAEVKIKLEELKKEIASKAAKLKEVIDQKLKDKAYVGQVKLKSETALTLATDYGPRIVNINQDTNFASKVKKKNFSAKVIFEEDYIAALGDVDENGVLTAREVILLPTDDSRPKTYLWGQIAAISDKIITLKDRSFKNMAVSLPDSADFKIGNFIILTGSFGKNNFFETDFTYIIPQGGILKPKRFATPSAQTSSPAAKPK
ncbi:hypothetical protein A3C26_02040 [Candidatus Daviesbacteria bacterium RIFCSPHIGHO2_02_FULL_39_12]|uniref:DUF5666 domain-containing protein n=1 Tax=Candidatus Daviesbacteria bacterium RIFCSPHIGHO2_02_FULL_39_12 TaxID=1797770 RepID=A0A1F5J941_9BACT|nr:MAG: hypothetical protein A3C26_02040 [Candidatus Daviesbacteria bacterium RIFCSPHIGHO2_02_FULL_39_12]